MFDEIYKQAFVDELTKLATPAKAYLVPGLIKKIQSGPYAKGYMPKRFVSKSVIDPQSMVELMKGGRIRSKSPMVSGSYIPTLKQNN